MDHQRLHARLRRVPAARRPRRRPARPQAAVPDRPRDLHDGLAAERPRVDRGPADRVPRAPGPRRGADLARGALDHLDHVRRGRGARQGARGLGRDRNRRRLDRPRARWGARAVLLVALDLLRQRPGRDRRIHPLGPAGARVARRACACELRHRRGGHRDRRPHGPRLRDREGGDRRLDLINDDRLLRPVGGPPGELRPDRIAERSAARPALDLSDSLTHNSQHRDVPRDVGDVRDVLLQHALHPGGARLQAAQGRARVPAVHGGRDRLGRPRVELSRRKSACGRSRQSG